MIITIGRQHGSNGHAVAETLAKRLNIPCYSKEIVDRTARDSNFSHEVIQSYDEKRISPFIAPTSQLFGMDEGFRLNMQIASAQFDAIRSLADEGDAVFVGRCADYVLRDEAGVFNVFIKASKENRIQRIIKLYNVDPLKAEEMIKKADKQRAAYYNYYATNTWGDVNNYDLCLDTGTLGVDGAVEVIASSLELRAAFENKKAIGEW